MAGLVLVLILVVGLIWFVLNTREKNRVAAGLPRHSGLRLVFAAVAGLTVVFSGGCGAVFLFSWVADGMKTNDYVSWEVIAVLALPPLAIGILVWWLSMRRG